MYILQHRKAPILSRIRDCGGSKAVVSLAHYTSNRSINQLINWSIDQSINQSINQSIYRFVAFGFLSMHFGLFCCISLGVVLFSYSLWYILFILPADNICVNEEFLQLRYGFLPLYNQIQCIYTELVSLVPSSLLHCG
jgi:hypothetical protein